MPLICDVHGKFARLLQVRCLRLRQSSVLCHASPKSPRRTSMQRMCFAVLKQLISACRRCFGDCFCIVRPRCLNIELTTQCCVPDFYASALSAASKDTVDLFTELRDTLRGTCFLKYAFAFPRNSQGFIPSSQLEYAIGQQL